MHMVCSAGLSLNKISFATAELCWVPGIDTLYSCSKAGQLCAACLLSSTCSLTEYGATSTMLQGQLSSRHANSLYCIP
jgi:hypothetical protein